MYIYTYSYIHASIHTHTNHLSKHACEKLQLFILMPHSRG